jgi:hypothetical protein
MIPRAGNMDCTMVAAALLFWGFLVLSWEYGNKEMFRAGC